MMPTEEIMDCYQFGKVEVMDEIIMGNVAPLHQRIATLEAALKEAVNLLFEQSNDLKPVIWNSNGVFGHGHSIEDKSSYYVNKDLGFIVWRICSGPNRCYKVWCSEKDNYYHADFKTAIEAKIFCLGIVACKFPNSYDAIIYRAIAGGQDNETK